MTYVRIAHAALLLIASLLPAAPSSAQDIPIRGVVWQPPDEYVLAARDLEKIRATGFNAVRTGVVQDERLLGLADQLGLAVFQELPLHYLSSARLSDTLSFAQRLLTDVVRRSAPYASARNFGVVRYADTADSTACAAVAALVESGRQRAPAGSSFYYTTLFGARDACAAEVDFILLDARDHGNTRELVRAWHEQQQVPAGLAAVGTWVRTGSPGGLRNTRSAEQQARYLEDRLNELLIDRPTPDLRSIFIYRWRDAEMALPLLVRADRDPYRATYGLHSAGMTERPAYSVVRSILTGSQSTFAFPPGDVTFREWPWITTFGWIAILLIGLLYAFSPRLRQMVPRYFRAHGFYRDAIREGRDLLLGSSLVVLISLGLAAGVTTAVGIDLLGDVMGFRILLSWFPEAFVLFLSRATVEPWLFALLTAALYAGGILIWIIVMMILSRTRYHLGPGQVLMLVVWPRWPLILLMLAALALHGSPESADTLRPIYILAGIAALWLLVTLHAIIRAIVDFTAIARVPAYVPVILFLLNPLIVTMVVATFAWLQYRADVEYALRVLLSS